MTPAAYVERVRLEVARTMLEASDEELLTIARRSGFGSVETLRRAFVREYGVPPSAYRARFRTSGIADADRRHFPWPRPPHHVPVSPPA